MRLTDKQIKDFRDKLPREYENYAANMQHVLCAVTSSEAEFIDKKVNDINDELYGGTYINVVRICLKGLRELGLVQIVHLYYEEDSKVRGTGYCRTTKGERLVKELEDS
jgi:hypothetical protein